MNQGEAPATLVEHFFRHESGRLTATLTKRFGFARLDAIEDAIQVAFERALGTWSRRGIPDEPSAWLTRVAVNTMLDGLRHQRVVQGHADSTQAGEAPSARLDDGVEDSLLLLFTCAHERLAPRTRLVLCLKLLSGFSTDEIAARLFLSRANVQKTLERGRLRLAELTESEGTPPRRSAPQRASGDGDSSPSGERMTARLTTVQQVLYLQFNEGYSFAAEDDRLRTELCEEAIRLTRMLASHELGNTPSSWALLALMHLNAARLPARVSSGGELVPLEHQDRTLWNQHHLALGLAAFRESARADEFSFYHGEAAIALEHSVAPSFAATRFEEIVELYETLERMRPSPVYALNRVIALAEVKGAAPALSELQTGNFPPWFQEHYLYQGTRGELLRRMGRTSDARPFLLRAADAAPSQAERRFLLQRAAECLPS